MNSLQTSKTPSNLVALDFIGIGAPKTGSSWLAQAIRAHPEVQMSHVKEVTFFNTVAGMYQPRNNNYRRGFKWYKRQFPEKRCSIMGEFSVDYLYDPNAAKRIKKHFPEIKIIITLRNPIDKMHSYYWWYRKTDKSEKEETFEKAIGNNKEYIKRSKYFPQLKEYYAQFPKNNIKVVLHSDIKKHPKKTIKEIYKFLDVSPNYVPSLLFRKVNPSRTTKSVLLSKILVLTKFLRESRFNIVTVYLRRSGIYDFLHKAYIKINMEQYKYPPMKSATRKRLVKILKKDIKMTEKITRRNLNHWLKS